jgi:hypothetical protein
MTKTNSTDFDRTMIRHSLTDHEINKNQRVVTISDHDAYDPNVLDKIGLT